MSEDKTKWIWTKGRDTGGTLDEGKSKPPIRGFDEEDDGPTRAVNSEVSGTLTGLADDADDPDDGATRHVGAAFDAESAPIEPVAGWFVIVKGPGIGASITIPSGQSSIGRDSGQRVCIGFGDNSISRVNHARIIYDPRSRKWLMLPGDGKNLTYVEENMLVSNVELSGGELISMGDTDVRFIPFCNDVFDWSDISDAKESAPE